MPDRVGQQLGNYRLIRLLGEGGFGDVYLAEHLFLKTQAAIKVLHTRLTQEDQQRFLSEAQIVARLRHPHIVQVFDFGIEGNTPYLAMDYAPGGTLRALHPRGIALPPAMILGYVKQVADALHYAHDQRLIHRDIKPENLLLGRDNGILLGDFGIATVAQTTSDLKTQGFAGTATYAAPEQLRGKPVQASDQYALAVIVYEWLTGDTPFHGSPLEVATQQVLSPPPPLREKLPTIAPAIEQVVLTALAKEPKERFGSVRAFANALEQAIQAAPAAFSNYGPPAVPDTYQTRPQQPGQTGGGSIYFAPTQLTPPSPSVQPANLPIIPAQATPPPGNTPIPLTTPAGWAGSPPPATPPPNLTYNWAAPPAPPIQQPPVGWPPAGPGSAGAPGVAVPPSPNHTTRNLVLALLVIVVLVGGGFALWATHTPGQTTRASGHTSAINTLSPTPNLAASQVLRLPGIGVQDVRTLDPALVIDQTSAQAVELAFSGMVTLDPGTLAVKPDLATSWSISPDGKTYTFHLRSGVKFSNGDPLTASDIAYSIDRAFDPSLNNQYGLATYYLPYIVGGADRAAGKIPTMIGAGLVVVDDQKLQISLTRPIAFFLDELTYPISWAVDRNVIQQYGANWFDGHAVGSGPFMLQSWQHRVQLTFVPNPSWYGARSHLTEIDMPLIPNLDTAFTAFQAKQIAVDNNVSSTSYAAAMNGSTSRQWQFSDGPALSIFYAAPNSAIPPFNNLTVRQAFAEAVDRDTLTNTILGGDGLPSDHIVPQGMPGYYAGLQGVPFNPTDARAKLSSVYPNLSQMPPVTLEYAGGGNNDKVVAKLQADFRTYLGVQINLHSVSFPQIINDCLAKNTAGIYPCQFYLLGWVADYPDPQDWLDQVTSASPYNTMNFRNAQVDSLVAQADMSLDPSQRIADYNQAEEVAIDNVAWIPYEQSRNVYISQNEVHGFVQDAQGLTPDTAWADVYICNGSCS